VLGSESRLLVAPALDRVEPHRPVHQVWRLPFVARPHMRVQEDVGVAQDLQIDATERRVNLSAGSFHRFSQLGHTLQVCGSLRAREV